MKIIDCRLEPGYLTIFFNVDRADQLDCRRWRDNIKKVVRQTPPARDK